MTNRILEILADEEHYKVLQAAYAYQLALVSHGRLNEDSFNSVQQISKEICNDLINTITPWTAQSLEDYKQRELNRHIAAYKQIIGDPSDPAVRAKLDEAIKAFLAEGKDNVGESADDVITRRLIERDEKRRKEGR